MLLKILFTLLSTCTIVHSEEQPQQGKYCQPIDGDSICKFPANKGYSLTRFPTDLHQTQKKAIRYEVEQFNPLFSVNCHADLKLFICSNFVPMCVEYLKMIVKPCRELCEEARDGCSPLMARYAFKWPFNCTTFPEGRPGVPCISNKNNRANPTISTMHASENISKTTECNCDRKRGKVNGLQGERMELKCKRGQTITIKKVAHKDSKCCASISKQILTTFCQGKRRCQFENTQGTFGVQCKGQVGKVSVKYRCEKQNKKTNDEMCPSKE